MKDFKDMTWEELDKARTELYQYIDKVRRQKRKEVYERVKDLVDELNSLTRDWNILLETVDCDGYTIDLDEDITVIKPEECD